MKTKTKPTYFKRTPTTLPPTMLQLGEKMGVSLSLDQARRVRSISQVSIGDSKGKPYADEYGNRYPYYYLRIKCSDGEIIDGGKLRNKRKLRDLHREVTKKIALFIFENQELTFEPSAPKPSRFAE